MRITRLAAAFALAALATFSQAEGWKFLVTGDDRSGKNRPEDHNGVNTLILGELSKAFLAEKPKFVLFSGDLINGPKTDVEMEGQLATWLETMKPVYDAGIKVYNIRGNHEMHVPHPDAVWQKMFVGPYALPTNGPKGEDEMSYTVSYENTLIIGLDEFQAKNDEAHINQSWLDETLAKKKAQHVFVFAHKMAFRSGHHDDGMELDPTARDKFVNSLLGAGARVAFFGHDHLYDHRALTNSAGKTLDQFVIGTAGAPLVTGNDELGNNTGWKVQKVKHIEGQYGYAVVEVDGPRVTITYKTRTAPGVYVAADSFSYTVK